MSAKCLSSCLVTLRTPPHMAYDIKKDGTLCYNWSIVMEHWCVCVCVYSHLLPCSCMTTWQCSNHAGTCGTKGSSYMVWGSMVCSQGSKSSGVLCLVGVVCVCLGVYGWCSALSLLLEFQGLLVLDQPSPHLSSVGPLFGFWFWFPVWVGLCLSIAFILVMNFMSLLIPFLVPTSLSSWVFLPVPSNVQWLKNLGHSFSMCCLVWTRWPQGHAGSSVLMNLL